MWAGCIWVPIYEVMTRKHLKIVTLEENLEMAADIGIDATTSLDEAFAAAMARHGPDAKVIVLPFARYQLPRNAIRMASDVRAAAHRAVSAPHDSGSTRRRRRRRRAPRLDHDRRDPAHVPGRRGGPPDVAARLAVRALRRRRSTSR